MNLQEFLGRKNVPFEMVEHRPTYEAQRMAHAIHTSGYLVAKTVLLKLDGGADFVVAVLSATCHVELGKAKQLLGCDKVELASEDELAQRCLDCERGVLPPFGSQYGMKTIVDQKLAEDEQIVFEGNTHDKAICMTYADYEKLEQPSVADFSEQTP